MPQRCADVETDAGVPGGGAGKVDYWERVAETRWGRYLSAIERAAMRRAAELAQPPSAALEIGCDGGRWSAEFAALGWKMVCTDINARALDICRSRIPGAECRLVSPADTRLPCDDDSVRLLLCIEVPPVVQADYFLPEAWRVLQTGGVAVAVFWNLWSWRGLLAHATARRRGESDFYRLPYAPWRRRWIRRGFQIVLEEGFCWFPFCRTSDSRWVGPCAAMEAGLGLRRLPALSPWVVLAARKGSA